MKTPLQEFIDIIKKRQEDDEALPFMYNAQIIELAELMLEKEKEQIEMTEQDLIDLGFKRIEDFDGDEVFHFYDLSLVEGFSLISNDSDNAKQGWYVELFDVDQIKFVKKKELEKFINIVKRNIKS